MLSITDQRHLRKHISVKQKRVRRDRSGVIRNAVLYARDLDRDVTANEISSIFLDLDIPIFPDDVEEVMNDL
jgi:hypothetical protein